MDRDTRKQAQLACQISLGLMAGIFSIVPTVAASPVQDTSSSLNTGATVTTSGSTTTVAGNQTNNVVAWKDFSVASGETVHFNGSTPDARDYNYLNVVTGANTSRIAGTIEGGNNVYIVNQHGVIIDKGATVNVGNLYVSTKAAATDAATVKAAIANNTGSAVLSAATTGTAVSDVVNLGTIQAGNVQVEGKNIRFLDSAKVLTAVDGGVNTNVTLNASGYAHVGNSDGSNAGYNNGADSVVYYKLVNDAEGLQNINNDLTKNYMLSQNIDASAIDNFTPIGNDASTPFTGKFDGMFYEVQNLNVSTDGNAGLFGNTSGARIDNVGVVGATIAATGESGNAGSIVGRALNNTVIRNVYSETSVASDNTVKGSVSGELAGGIVGYLKGTLSSSYNTTSVNSINGGRAGGIAGRLESGSITDAYNTGAVTGDSGLTVSGITYAPSGASVTRVYNTYGALKLVEGNNNGLTSGKTFDATDTTSSNDTAIDKAKHISTYVKSGSNTSTVDKSWTDSSGNSVISTDGTTNTTWRLYEGQSTPLLTAFFQGTTTADYSYNYFTKDGTTATSTGLTLAGNTNDPAVNGGADLTGLTYNAQYLKIAAPTTDSSGATVTSTSTSTDADSVKGYVSFGSNVESTDENIDINTAGVKDVAFDGDGNVTAQSLIYSGQHGYNIVGGNVTIGQREVSARTDKTLHITKEYDGTTDATTAIGQQLGGDNVTVGGLLAGDDVALEGLTASYADKNVGTDKTVSYDGSKATLTGTSAANYHLADNAFDGLTITGDITPRSLYVKLNSSGSFDKTYNGTADVENDAASVANNVAIDTNQGDAHQIVTTTDSSGKTTTEDVSINPSSGTIQYYNGDTTVSDSNAATNTDSYTIRYSGITLQGNDAGNYQLVVADATAANGYKVLYDGSTSTSNADTYLTAAGKINQRVIDPTTFQVVDKSTKNVLTAEKDYDGTSTYSLPTDAQGNLTAEISPTGTSSIANSGLVSGENILFTPTGTANFTKSDGKTLTSQVNDAALVAVGLSAAPDPNATKTTKLTNYTWGQNGSTLTSTGTYDVTIAGTIHPRKLYIDVSQPNAIDKQYDGNAKVLDADAATFNQKNSSVKYVSGSKQIVMDAINKDTPTITVTPTYASKNSERPKDVAYDAGKVTSKYIDYAVTLSGAEAANYELIKNGDKATGKSVTSLTFKGSATKSTGTITQKSLTSSFTKVTKTYDGTKNLPSGTTASGTLNSGSIVTGDDVTLNIKNAEYQSANVNGDGTTKTINNTVQKNWVNYTGLSLSGADKGNYSITSSDVGEGDITKLALGAGAFTYTFTPITKEYDGTDTVATADAQKGIDTITVTATGDVFKGMRGTTAVDYTNGNISATYDSANSGGQAKQDVHYKVTIFDDNSGNYVIPTTGIQATTTGMASNNGYGIITPRKVVATPVGALTKTYDATDTATATNGKPLVTYAYAGTQSGPQQGLINNGTVTDTDNSTAVYKDTRLGYSDADAGTTADKTVAYTIGLKTADPTNYEVVDSSGNTLYTGGKVTANTLSGTGSIDKRALKITFGYTDKSWDGSDVATGNKTAVNATLDDSNAAGNKDGKNGIVNTDSTDTVFQSNLSKIVGNYVDSNGKSQTNAGTGFTVNYSKIDDAFKVTNNGTTTDYGRNYTFSLTGTGTGDIDPLTITGNNLHLDFAGITKEYDGGNSVVGNGSTTSYGAADYITDNWVDVDGDKKLTSKDVILGGGKLNGASAGLQSMIQSATYDDAQGNAGTSKGVTYELNLGKTNNFSFGSGFTNITTGSNASTSYANGVLTAKTTGDITKRKIVASPVGTITKTYDATPNLPSTAGTLISYTHYGTPGAGLVGSGDKDASTGKFIQSDAGSGKNLVTYNLAINNGNNYEIVNSQGTAISTIDGAGTINKRALTINFGKTVKSWDGSDVATGNITAINATLDDKTGNSDGKSGIVTTDGTDAVFQSNLSKITGQYLSGGKSQTNAGKNFDVQYSNYANALIDAQNNDFGKNYIITAAMGKGDIDPLAINSKNFHLDFSGITKEYDGTDDVVGTGGTSSYGSGDYVTLNWIDVDGDNTLTKKDVVLGGGSTNGATAGFQKLIQSATYDNNANGNVGNGQGVTYVLNLGNPQNYTFTGFTNVKTGKYTTASYANGKLTANTIGDITKRKVVASATNANPTKTYDAGTALVNSTKYPLTTPLVSYTHYGTAGAGLVGSDKDASTGKYTSAGAGTGSNKVRYSLAINNGSNYEIVDSTGKAISTLDGTGTINKAPLTIDFGDVWKVYDGNADVTTSSGAQYSGTTAPSSTPQTAITPTLSGFVGGQNVAFDPTATKLISGSYVKWDPSTKTWVVNPHVNWQNVNTQTLGYKAVGYSNLEAAFNDLATRNSVLANYELTGATNAGASVTANASGIAQSVYFSEALKKGQILPLALTMGNIQSKVTTTTKEYDGTADVKDPTKTLTLFENLTGKNVVIPYTLQSATYDNGQVDQTNSQKVGVTYTLDAKNPFPAMTLNDFVINGTTQQAYQGKTFTGDGVINPKNIYVQLDKTSGIKKEYDHSTNADPDNVQYFDKNGTLLGTGNNTGNIIVSRDQGKVSLSVKSALFDNENATIERANSTSQNAQNITYTVDLDDATNKGNYVLLDTNAKAAGTPTAVTVTNPTTGATTTLTQTENVYKATGDIYRAAIKVQSNGQSVQTGKQPSAYTGKTSGWFTGDADSTAWTSAGGDKQLTWNVLPGATTGSAGSYDIYGWYRDPQTGDYPSTSVTTTDPTTNDTIVTTTYTRPDSSTLTQVTDQTTGVVTWSGVDAQDNALPASALTGWFASLDPTNATATDWASDGTAEYQIKTGNYGTNYYFEQVPSQLTVYTPSHHSGGGGGGTKPVTPVTPVTPDNPVTPVTPDNPVTPVIPDVPDDPVLPVNPLDISKETNPAKQFVPNSEAYNNASHDDFGSVTRSGQAGIEYASGGINVAGAETPTVSTSDVDNAAIGLQNAGSIVNLSGGDAMEVSASRIDLTGGDSFTVTVDDGTTYDSSAAIETTGAQTKDSAAAVDTTALDATGTQTKDGAAAVDTTALDATSTLETTSDATSAVETVEPDATLTTTQQMLTTEDVQLFADATSLNDAEETEETEDEDEERKEADASAAADESAIGIESEGAGVKVA